VFDFWYVLHDSLLGLSLLFCVTACCVVERLDLTIIKAAYYYYYFWTH